MKLATWLPATCSQRTIVHINIQSTFPPRRSSKWSWIMHVTDAVIRCCASRNPLNSRCCVSPARSRGRATAWLKSRSSCREERASAWPKTTGEAQRLLGNHVCKEGNPIKSRVAVYKRVLIEIHSVWMIVIFLQSSRSKSAFLLLFSVFLHFHHRHHHHPRPSAADHGATCRHWTDGKSGGDLRCSCKQKSPPKPKSEKQKQI